MQFAAQDREVFLNYQLLTIFLLVLFLLVLFFVRHKQSNNSDKQSAHASKGGHKSAAHTASSEDGNDWIEKVNQTVPMRIIKTGNGVEAAQMMQQLLFPHKKSIR